jgi:hypothetical protein
MTADVQQVKLARTSIIEWHPWRSFPGTQENSEVDLNPLVRAGDRPPVTGGRPGALEAKRQGRPRRAVGYTLCTVEGGKRGPHCDRATGIGTGSVQKNCCMPRCAHAWC